MSDLINGINMFQQPVTPIGTSIQGGQKPKVNPFQVGGTQPTGEVSGKKTGAIPTGDGQDARNWIAQNGMRAYDTQMGVNQPINGATSGSKVRILG